MNRSRGSEVSARGDKGGERGERRGEVNDDILPLTNSPALSFPFLSLFSYLLFLLSPPPPLYLSINPFSLSPNSCLFSPHNLSLFHPVFPSLPSHSLHLTPSLIFASHILSLCPSFLPRSYSLTASPHSLSVPLLFLLFDSLIFLFLLTLLLFTSNHIFLIFRSFTFLFPTSFSSPFFPLTCMQVIDLPVMPAFAGRKHHNHLVTTTTRA